LQTYREYLKSEHWINFKKESLNFLGHKCQRCGSTRKVIIHHKTYINRGHEALADVEALCKRCHQIEHLDKVINSLQQKGIGLNKVPALQKMMQQTQTE
jgi:5-methylcytosine-specific restriction endonuclease McrA